MEQAAQQLERRVLVLAPISEDVAMMEGVLAAVGEAFVLCARMDEVCRELDRGAGALLLAEEALMQEASIGRLEEALARQPAWSDLPVLVLSNGGAGSPLAAYALDLLGNVILLERPVRAATLVSVVRTALRARGKQYQIRDQMSEDQQRAAAALRQSEERLRLVIEASQDGFWDWDIRPDRAMCSDQALRLLGYEPGELTPSYALARQIIHPEDAPREAEAMRAHLEEGRPYDLELRLRRKDGAYGWFHSQGLVQRDGNGRPVRMVGSFRDITARKQDEAALRESEARFRRLIETSFIGLAICDVDGCILYANPAVLGILGFTPEDVRGLHCLDFTPPEFVAQHEHAVAQTLATGVSEPYEKDLLAKHGRRVPVLMGSSLITQDAREQPLIAYFITDLTRLKQVEAELREADRRKDEFLAMLAHELRNPLAPIRNAIQLMRARGGHEPLLERQQNIIDRQITHMARLLNDLLDVSRITRGMIELHCQPLPLGEALTLAVDTARPLIESRHHLLTLIPPPPDLLVQADLDRLAQIVGNLLTNAAKYTDEGGRIWLEAGREDDEAVIRVRDTGVGIAPELLPHVFDLFTQADRSLDRSQGGLGIGLTLVQKLVQMHGGSVEAYSAGLGQGSEFTIRLPALPAHTDGNSHSLASGPGAGEIPRRVLVVDDLVDAAESLAELLRLWGHEVRTAHDGLAALKSAREFLPDLVLLDLGLPGMNGYEVARQLRHDPALSGIPLVALTGYGQDEDRRRTREAGFKHHLTKPVNMEALQLLLAQSPIA